MSAVTPSAPSGVWLHLSTCEPKLGQHLGSLVFVSIPEPPGNIFGPGLGSRLMSLPSQVPVILSICQGQKGAPGLKGYKVCALQKVPAGVLVLTLPKPDLTLFPRRVTQELESRAPLDQLALQV